MCDECSKLMKITRFKCVVSSLGCVISSVIESQQNGLSELKAELSKNNQQVTDVLAENKKRVAELKNIVNSATPGRAPNKERPLKRRREEATAPTVVATGTRKVANNGLLAVQPSPDLFWVYLSRFHPSVREEVVEGLVRDGLRTQAPIKVISLVKKGADISSMNFVSFKVGVPIEFKDAALDPDSWPEGIVFREFEGQSKNRTWLPPVIPVAPDQTRIGYSIDAPSETSVLVQSPIPLGTAVTDTISDDA